MRIVLFLNLMLEFVKYILAGEAIFKRRLKRRYGVGLFITISGIILEEGITDKVQDLSILVIPLLFIVFFLTLDGACRDRIVYLCKLTILILYMDYVIEMFLKLFVPVEIKSESGWLISNVISILLYGGIYFIQKYKKRWINTKLEQVGNGIMYAGIAMMAVAIPLTIASLNNLAKYCKNAVSLKKIQFLSALSMLGIVVLILFLIYIQDINQKMKRFLEIERALKQTQKNYYDALIQKEEETKKFRHDAINHIMCIQELAQQGELEAVKQYINGIHGEMERIQKCCYSVGNMVLDAVLNRYLSMLPEDVKIRVSGFLQEQLPISDVELCTIFSNLMRNSVEELQKQEKGEKYITVKVHTGENDFTLEICNSATGEKPGKRGGLPETSKKEKEKHGYGLHNVKETIEKNYGSFQWESTTEKFKVKVRLPLRSRG